MLQKALGVMFAILILLVLLGFGFIVQSKLQPAPESMTWGGLSRAEIIDGDTIIFNGERLRLLHIDACEIGQQMLKGSERLDCGIFAKRALMKIVGDNLVQCSWTERDIYDRPLSTCTTRFNNTDLALSLVELGAVPLSNYERDKIPTKLLLAEIEARRSKVGIWAYKFEDPYIYRKQTN